MTRLRTAAATFAGCALVAGLLAAAPTASASVTYPSTSRISAASHTALTVTLPAIKDPDLTKYVVAASTDHTQVSVDHLRASAYANYRYVASSTTPSVTLHGLKYTTSPYYWRVGVTYGRHGNFIFWAKDSSGPVGLRPSAPTAVSAHSGAHGTYLSWTPSAASGLEIEQARDASFRTGRVVYTPRSTTGRFTPYGLTRGTRYWFRMSALTCHTQSATTSPTVSVVAGAREQKIRVMSYNLLGAYLDGTKDAGPTVASWTRRVVSAGRLVAAAKPDVLTVQEANTALGTTGAFPAGYVAYPGTSRLRSPVWKIPASGRTCNQLHYSQKGHYPYRQVDSLCDETNSLLKTRVYARAVDGNIHHNGYGSNLIYNRTTMAPLHNGGYFLLDRAGTASPRWAGWAAFTVRKTGAKVLVVTPHTSPQLGSSYDTRRATQVTNMIRQAKAKAAAFGITNVVYAGDYNNYVGRAGVKDVTTPIAHANHLPDAIENARSSHNTQYLSSNFYTRSPKKTPDGKPGYRCNDHIYVTPGIGVAYFAEALRLNSTGQFVDAAIPSDHNPVYADLTLPY